MVSMALMDEATTRETQSRLALAKANRTRTRIRELKVRAKAGEDVTELLLEAAGNKFIGEVLMWLPGVGDLRATEIMREAHVATPLRRCRTLSPRQRALVAERARAAAWRRPGMCPMAVHSGPPGSPDTAY